jgi:hypothetical protein
MKYKFEPSAIRACTREYLKTIISSYQDSDGPRYTLLIQTKQLETIKTNIITKRPDLLLKRIKEEQINCVFLKKWA